MVSEVSDQRKSGNLQLRRPCSLETSRVPRRRARLSQKEKNSVIALVCFGARVFRRTYVGDVALHAPKLELRNQVANVVVLSGTRHHSAIDLSKVPQFAAHHRCDLTETYIRSGLLRRTLVLNRLEIVFKLLAIARLGKCALLEERWGGTSTAIQSGTRTYATKPLHGACFLADCAGEDDVKDVARLVTVEVVGVELPPWRTDDIQ